MSTTTLTSRQRVNRAIHHQDHDRVPRHDSYWAETIERWQREGLTGNDRTVYDWLGSDIDMLSGGDIRTFPVQPTQIIEENEQVIVQRNEWGATLQQWKNRAGTPEHLTFDCDRRSKWETIYRPALLAAPPRVDPTQLRQSFQHAHQVGRWTCLFGNETFEMLRKLMGDEIMLMTMAEDPDWVREISVTYTDLTIRNIDAALACGIQPDGMWIYGDMAYSRGTFCSPAMYRELIWPDHCRLAQAAHTRGMKLIYHTDGDVNGVLDLYREAGFDMLQPLEAKANMDIRRIGPTHGKDFTFFGNIDATVLCTNDRDKVEAEVRSKLAAGMANRGYIYHSDHSVPPGVSLATYRFVIELLDQYGNYA